MMVIIIIIITIIIIIINYISVAGRQLNDGHY